MKVFISHKQEDANIAKGIYGYLTEKQIEAYLDVLDEQIVNDGEALTVHLKKKLNECSDILVVMSENTRYSQWVPFEVGMAAQTDKPTVTFLQEYVLLPEFLDFWPRLKELSDLDYYIETRQQFESNKRGVSESYYEYSREMDISQFYEDLKLKLGQK